MSFDALQAVQQALKLFRHSRLLVLQTLKLTEEDQGLDLVKKLLTRVGVRGDPELIDESGQGRAEPARRGSLDGSVIFKQNIMDEPARRAGLGAPLLPLTVLT